MSEVTSYNHNARYYYRSHAVADGTYDSIAHIKDESLFTVTSSILAVGRQFCAG